MINYEITYRVNGTKRWTRRDAASVDDAIDIFLKMNYVRNHAGDVVVVDVEATKQAAMEHLLS